MTDTIIGRAVTDATAIADSVTRGLENGVREFPSRVKCATLAWQTLRGALQGQTTPISTE